MVTKQAIAELKRTLAAMELYEKGQTERTGQFVVMKPGKDFEYSHHETRPDLWPDTDQNHSSASRASMDLTKVLAKWRKTGKPYPRRAK